MQTRLRTFYRTHDAEAIRKTVESCRLHAPMSSFHKNQWEFASVAVSRYNYNVLVADSVEEGTAPEM